MIYGKGQEHTRSRAPKPHQCQFIKGKKAGNQKNQLSAWVAATFLWDGLGSKETSFLLQHHCQNTQIIWGGNEKNPLITANVTRMSQVPGLDGYWWGGKVEFLSEEFLARQLQKLTLSFTKMMKFPASVWEDNKIRWEEQLLQLKEEIFKGKMQKIPWKLYKTTALLDLDILPPPKLSPELQKMPGPKWYLWKFCNIGSALLKSELSAPQGHM